MKIKQLDIEEIINKNINVEKLDLGLKLISKEYSTPLGRIDILCVDRDEKYVPIEIKVGTASDSAIGQILRYMHTMKSEWGIIMANDFTKGVKAISKDLNIKLISYTIDVIIDNKSIVSNNVEDDIDNSVKGYHEIYPQTKKWFKDNIRVTGNRDDRLAICDIRDKLLKSVNEIKKLPKKNQLHIIRNLLDFDNIIQNPKLTTKNSRDKQNIAIGGIIWK